MLKYVDSVASQQVPPPYVFPNTTVHAFVWRPDMSKVKAYCDTYLNLKGRLQSSGVVYEPFTLWPFATLFVIDYPVMACADPGRMTMYTTGSRHAEAEATSEAPGAKAVTDAAKIPFSQRGYTSQREVFVAFPLLRRGRDLRRLATQTMIEWAIPLIIVQNPDSAICGREMLGLEKLCGGIEVGEDNLDVEHPSQGGTVGSAKVSIAIPDLKLPQSSTSAATGSASATAVFPSSRKLPAGATPGNFWASVQLRGWESTNAAQVQKFLPFLDVTCGPVLPSIWAPSANVTSALSLLRSRTASKALEAAGVMRDFLDDSLAGLLPNMMQLVALKQFRDAEHPGKAVYQALVGCRTKFSNIVNFRVYNEHDVSLNFHNRGSFCEIVELLFDAPKNPSMDQGDDQVYSLPAVAACRFNARIDLDQMRTLHTFPIDGASGEPPADDWTVPWLKPWQGFMAKRPPSTELA
jgi:hypothetical protein